MSLLRVLAVALVLLLVAPAAATSTTTSSATNSKTVGFSAGDSVEYNYVIQTINTTLVGKNVVNVTYTQYDQFTINILSVNNTSPDLGVVGYAETLSVFDSETLSTPSTTLNNTAIFDPFLNYTYLANIGFYPFTYANLAAGNVTNLPVKVPYSGFPGSTGVVSTTSKVNATVVRTKGSIDVAIKVLPGPGVEPWRATMDYNSTTGVLDQMSLSAVFFDTPKIFTYQLISYNHPKPLNLGWVVYVVVAGIAVFVVVALIRRKPDKQKRVDKMREKFKGKTSPTRGAPVR